MHLLVWVIWYSATNISAIIDYKQTPWVPAFYNFISFALVFYATYCLSRSYFKRISLVEGLKLNSRKRIFFFLFRAEIFGMVGVILGNIVISWNVDHILFGQKLNLYISEDFLRYADGKFSRSAFYFSTAIGTALALAVIKRKNEIIAAKDALIATNEARLDVEKFDNAFLRRALKEKQERNKLFEEYFLKNQQ